MYTCFADIEHLCAQRGISPAQLFLESEMQLTGRTEKEIYDLLDARLTIMEDSATRALYAPLQSVGGLIDGLSMTQWGYSHKASSLCGSFLNRVMAKALSCAEVNASMGRICAAPTAGSCGILPAAILTLMRDRGIPEEKAVMALFTAGAIGMVIAQNASISGAEGGCQAECGSAAAMAAAALVEMMGGTPTQAGHACAIAIKNQLGLVCDPVAGLVEIPCIKRNVAGVSIAFSSAELALAGIESKIPVDEVVDAMRRVGESIPCSLRETAQGGLAATPTGKKLRRQIFGA